MIEDLCRELKNALEEACTSGKVNYDGLFPAAVLVPIVFPNNEPEVLFEVRSSHLSWQPGEICFPGGRIERSDDSPLVAAIRETREELRVSAEEITILGSLPSIASPIGVNLHPYVGHISPLKPIVASEGEVAEIFTVPLRFLAESQPVIAHMEMGTRPLADFPFSLVDGYSKGWMVRKSYQVLFYKYKEYVIWGITAQVLQGFLEIYKSIIKNKNSSW